jgi:hypothetical protein
MADNVAQDFMGGHTPAVKVGGLRMVKHKTPQKEEKTPPPKPTEEEVEEFGEDKKEKKAGYLLLRQLS